MSIRRLVVLVVLPALLVSAGPPPSQKVESGGVTVELLTSRPLENEDVDVRFAIRGADGIPLRNVRPAAWIDSRGKDGEQCKDKVQSFLAGSLRARPVVDLNSYYILTLNAEPSIAVIDPLLGFGGSKLLTAVSLQSPGVDWVLSADQRRLFVSMPLVNRIAVIETETWSVVTNIETAFRPARLALQRDELWVTHQNELASDPSLTIIDAKTLAIVTSLATGRGAHQLAFSPDGRRAFVTNAGDGTISILSDVVAIQPGSAPQMATIATGPSPAGIATSTLSAATYVIDGVEGSIAVIEPGAKTVSRRIAAKPGLGSIRFAPGGRWGFVTNAKENVVQVIDASTATIVTTATDVGKGPDQIAFTDDFAYVRAAQSDQVRMIQLAALGKDREANIATFPAGQIPPAAAAAESFADAIVPAPEPKAVLVANPADRLVYYYMEGMAAPLGNFSAVKRAPKAALVVDRSLREREPGVFSIRTKVPAAGDYDVAFFLNDPRVVHCFPLTVRPNPASTKTPAPLRVKVEPLLERKAIHVGEELEMRFRLTRDGTRELQRGARDVRALAFLAPGIWQQRISAEPTDDGLYRVKLTVPEPGIYYVFLESSSLHLKLNASRPLIFEAVGAERKEQEEVR